MKISQLIVGNGVEVMGEVEVKTVKTTPDKGKTWIDTGVQKENRDGQKHWTVPVLVQNGDDARQREAVTIVYIGFLPPKVADTHLMRFTEISVASYDAGRVQLTGTGAQIVRDNKWILSDDAK